MKTMTWLSVMLTVTLVSAAISQEQRRLGEIRFMDGTKQEFEMANLLRHDPSYDAKGLQLQKTLFVYLNKVKRELLFDKVDSIRVLPRAVEDSGVVRGDLEVTTIRGLIFASPISISEIVVTIFEEPSGALKEVAFPFVRENKLYIRSVVFPRGSSGL